MRLVLASSSPYRRALLQRLQLPFAWANPDIDETPAPGEDIDTLVRRLAVAKARMLGPRWPDSLIIASDQACRVGTDIVGKPGTFAVARRQLQACSGQTVNFHTALALYDSAGDNWQVEVERYSVRFRSLSNSEIDYYLQQEQPYDCAGSFKVEGLGVALFTALEGADYHSLIGLPLLQLCTMLRAAGVNPLLPPAPASPAPR